MKKTGLFFVASAAMTAMISCASAPPAQPQQEPAAAVEAPAAAPAAELERAKSMKAAIDTYGLAAYDQAKYDSGVKDLAAGEAVYGTDGAASKKSLLSAIGAFEAVMQTGWPLKVAEAQAECEASRSSADALLASAAVTSAYVEADDVYKRALQQKDAGEHEKAFADFNTANGMFAAAAETAQSKKDEAELALQRVLDEISAADLKAYGIENSLRRDGIDVPGGGE